MIKIENGLFYLETAHTAYAFRLLENGYLQHLYYGSKETSLPDGSFRKRNANVRYSKDYPYCLENIPLEYSSVGKGDVREPLVVVTRANGLFTGDFVYQSHSTTQGKPALDTLPSAYGADEALTVSLKDPSSGLTLQLHYGVFVDTDVIVRSSRLVNTSQEAVTVNRLLSAQLDFDGQFSVTSFTGAWAEEMHRCTTPVQAGKFVISSNAGISAYRANPFFMLSQDAQEDAGECYGINLIYSGNHYSAVQTNVYGQTRVVTGINPDMFAYRLAAGEALEAPEAVLCYSDRGFNSLSDRLHRFIRNHIIRGKYQYQPRPVLLNSWEANYFSINEEKLVQLGQKAKELGMEMLVVDDGWFQNRKDDHRALGDWIPDSQKLPDGLAPLVEKINALGLQFGIWMEPEMISVDSDLYRAHPDWAMACENHSEGRNQRILDLLNPQVERYVIDAVSAVLDSANICYVKWDMNRIFSDIWSPSHPGGQTETIHRYYLALYRIMDTLTKKYPDVLFEGCASGGARFDLGILCYFPQNWASDNTDAVCRKRMQNSYSYGYPQLVYTNHVSICPNHQTGRSTSLEHRFLVASAGNLGYELNLTLLSDEEREAIRQQVAWYKENRELLQFGQLIRTDSGWIIRDGDKQLEFKLQEVSYTDQ